MVENKGRFVKGCISLNKGRNYKCKHYNLTEKGRLQKIKNLGNGMLNKKQSDYQKERMKKIHTGKIISDKQRKQISDTHRNKGLAPPKEFWFKKGYVPWNKDMEMPLEFGKKISATKRGISIEEVGNIIKIIRYSKEFYSKRVFVKIRDRNCCQICGAINCFLDVHHIDYNKENNQLSNLISLCKSCHSKTNKNRSQWFERLIIGGISNSY